MLKVPFLILRLEKTIFKTDNKPKEINKNSAPQTVTSLYAKDGKVWYTVLEHDWSKDGICCPSVTITAELKFENGRWIGIPMEPINNR